MKMLFLNWRDIKHPQAGGAEIYTHEVAKHLAGKGNEVTLLSALYPGAKTEENIDGVNIIRMGSQFSVHFKAYKWYRANKKYSGAKPQFDIVVEEMNTIPFLTPLYMKKERKTLLIFQLAREVWWYEAPFPVNLIGFMAEPLYLRFYRKLPVVTCSRSTMSDLIKHGFDRERISVFLSGVSVSPVAETPLKEKEPTMIFVGRLTKSKRVHHAIEAFFHIKKQVPTATLWICGKGSGSYEHKLRRTVTKYGLDDSVRFWGYVSESRKVDLLSRSHLVLIPSVKEGWGIIAIEAAACGTPSITYDVSGLRDSVVHDHTGVICRDEDPKLMAKESMKLLSSPNVYKKLQVQGLARSSEFSWTNTANMFERFIFSL